MIVIKKSLKETKALQEKTAEEHMFTRIAILSGSFLDLNVFDFSILNLRFVKFSSAEFNKLIKIIEFHKGQLARIIKRISEEHLDNDRLQVLVPINFEKPINESDLWLVRNLLLTIFPSDISIVRLIELQIITNEKFSFGSITSYNFKTTGKNIFDNYLKYYSHEVESVNKFIPIYIGRHDKIPYLVKTIHAYLSSFFQNFTEMEYLSLCIALESIINGKTELTYRIRRNVAILLTSDIELGKNVFKNIGEIYDLRSAIAHSTGTKYDRLQIYLPYLRKVISRLIIELLSLNISDIDTLNQKLTYVGFGDRKKLSDDYIEYELSSSVTALAVAQDIKDDYNRL